MSTGEWIVAGVSALILCLLVIGLLNCFAEDAEEKKIQKKMKRKPKPRKK